MAADYAVSGASDIKIREAFGKEGVGRCLVFGYDWIVRQIRSSPRLSYAQAQLILAAMGNDLQRLVVTEAHRKSVRAMSAHNLVLLLGAPAAGK
ncbi:hypothetical protein A5906_01010 [Bradyrhizobium sacchari]|uniref:hypothetical protein n=1 Tax=Bradyrhizobium sacchari TaxID=1399419 RepID=UPI0009D2022A|nr:hypothetical protein [Bradyrhizobium sacchari]OPY96780.1 hypothetical protein A5906_01010 [Bradyrhizobium sacchari]